MNSSPLSVPIMGVSAGTPASSKCVGESDCLETVRMPTCFPGGRVALIKGACIRAEVATGTRSAADSSPWKRERKPLVHGPQAAVIVGPAGEEIHSDEFGRVKVQFHWDREGRKDENSSCWIRVAQDWAGAGRSGLLYVPRIGQEVVVDFLDGDPDRPIVTGRVYNSEDLPPSRFFRTGAR